MGVFVYMVWSNGSHLLAKALLQFTQLILLLQQRQSLVQTFGDLQNPKCMSNIFKNKEKKKNDPFFFFFLLTEDPHWSLPERPVARVNLRRSEQHPCHSDRWGYRLLSVLPASSAELILCKNKKIIKKLQHKLINIKLEHSGRNSETGLLRSPQKCEHSY